MGCKWFYCLCCVASDHVRSKHSVSLYRTHQKGRFNVLRRDAAEVVLRLCGHQLCFCNSGLNNNLMMRNTSFEKFCDNVSVHSEKNNRNISVWKNPFGSHLLCVFFWAVLWLPVASRNLSGKFNNLCARVCVFVTEISEESVAVSLVSVGFSVLSRFSVRCVRRCVCRWTQHENLTKSDKFDLQSYERCCFIVCMFCVRNSNIKRYVSVHDCVSVSLCFLLCVKQQCVCMHVWRTAVASVLTGCSNCSLFSALSKCFKIAHYTLT